MFASAREAPLPAYAYDAVDLDQRPMMDHVEHALVANRIDRRLGSKIVVVAESAAQGIDLAKVQRDHDVDVTRHPRLGIEVHRHRTRQHVLNPGLI